MPAAGPEDRLLARARWLLSAQIAAVITAVVLLVGGVSLALMVHGQHTDGRRELTDSLRSATIAHPWPCVWMFAESDGRLRRTPAAPDALPVRADLAAVSRARPVRISHRRIGGIDYLVRTEWHPARRLQAALDLRYQAEERSRLYLALVVSEAIGLIASVVTGRLLAGRAIRPLAEAIGRQRRFVADASHELRTPLTQLHTRAQLLARRLPVDADPATAEQVHRLVDGTRQFGEVLDDLLLAAEPGGGRVSQPVDLATVVAAAAAAEDARIGRHELRLTVATGPGPHRVLGAAAALRRVVAALLDNAIGHTVAGGTIRLGLDRRADTVVVTVTDDGVGLTGGSAGRLFDRFSRGEHGAGRRYGLGLALARDVVDSHGGTIEADGAPGRGATFTVRLPAAPGQPPAAEEVAQRAASSSATRRAT